LIAIFILVVFVATAYLFVRINNQRNGRLQTALIEKQQQEEKEREYQKEIKIQKDIAAMMRGEKKVLEGVVENINKSNKKLVIDIDPLGKQKQYSISISKNVKYFILELKPLEAQVEPESNQENLQGNEYKTVIKNAQFDNIKLGQYVEVQFAKRIDVDSGAELIARKVTILEN